MGQVLLTILLTIAMWQVVRFVSKRLDVPIRGTVRCYNQAGERIDSMVQRGHGASTIVFSGAQTGYCVIY